MSLYLKKRILICVILILSLFLTSCDSDVLTELINVINPSEISVNGVIYQTGFYGALWPNDFILGEMGKTDNGKEYHKVDNNQFSWIQYSTGIKESGEFFCDASQWDEAKEFYSDSSNFEYYLKIGGVFSDIEPIEITDIDEDKFNELLSFASEHEYNPFGNNDNIETQEFDEPDKNQSPNLVFYKESKDGYFTSYKGYSYHIVEGKMVQLFYYSGSGEEAKMIAVVLPEDLGQYFIGLLSDIEY